MKSCPYCIKEVSEDAVKCKHCGGWFVDEADVKQRKMDQEKQLEKVLQEKSDNLGDIGEQTQYFSVPTKKIIILSILSFGIYEIYWFYQNWKAIKTQEGKKLSPSWRAIFYVFFCYSLFKRVLISASKKGHHSKFSHGVLTTVYILIIMTYKLPDPFSFLCAFSFIPLIYVADAIRFNNKAINPDFVDAGKFAAAEIFIAIFGVLLWYVTILSYVIPR